MSDSTIDSSRLDRIFLDCLYRDEETNGDGDAPPGAVIVEGVQSRFGFHPGRLESHRAEVTAMLDELPDQFKVDSGGGWSFLNGCTDRHGTQWTDFHARVEQLFALGMGLGMVSYLMPKALWNALPGGMPYLTVDTRKVASPVA